MRRFRMFSTAAVLLACTASTPAHAAYDATCGFVASTDLFAGQGQITGVMVVALYASDSGGGRIEGTIRCTVRVNGADQPGAELSSTGVGVAPNAGVITFTSSSVADHIELCIVEPVADCRDATVAEILPPYVRDSVVCPLLALAGPGLGPLFIHPDGDAIADGQPVYDCPPYATAYESPRSSAIWVNYGRW